MIHKVFELALAVTEKAATWRTAGGTMAQIKEVVDKVETKIKTVGEYEKQIKKY